MNILLEFITSDIKLNSKRRNTTWWSKCWRMSHHTSAKNYWY